METTNKMLFHSYSLGNNKPILTDNRIEMFIRLRDFLTALHNYTDSTSNRIQMLDTNDANLGSIH